MSRRLLLIGAAVLCLGGAALLFWQSRHAATPPPVTAATPPAAAPTAANPAAPAPEAYPIGKPADAPLPLTTEQTDAALAAALSDFIGRSAFTRWVRPDRLAQRIVATVDNLGRPGAGFEPRLVRYVGGNFLVQGNEEAATIAPENAQRYQPLMALLNAADLAKLVGEYTRLYPLLQSAYLQLGNRDAHFNDRVVQVIDLLLQTPEISTPLQLQRPGVMYQYKDPQLEQLSSGQKLLLRMGPANQTQVKVRLRALRALLTANAVAR